MISEGGKNFLLKIKHRALRANNSWYRALSIDKRRFIDAVIQTVDKIQSLLLLKILTKFISKLVDAMGGIRCLSWKNSLRDANIWATFSPKNKQMASNWGNKRALTWSNDEGFIRYLTVIEANNCQFSKTTNKLPEKKIQA